VSRFRSTRERRLWIAVAVAVGLLLAALYPLQFVLDALRARNLLRLSIAGTFLLCAATVAGALVRRRAPLGAWLVLVLGGVVYAALALAMEVPQERLHLVEYGALALLLRAAFAEHFAEHFARRLADHRVRVASESGPVNPVPNLDILTVGAATAIGWLDEAVQGILPNRQYDLRDVGFNAVAAGLALALAALLRAASKRDGKKRELSRT
jgi:hypothetical protein